MKRRCIVIPAIKKSAVIPDQLVKRLAGKTLMQRALDTALGVAAGGDVTVVTDSDEIRLICQRAGVRCDYNPAFTIVSLDIVSSLRASLNRLAGEYERIIIYRASSPLITAEDVEDAFARFAEADSDCLVTVKSVKHRLWEEKGQDLDALLFNDEEQTAYVETKALFMLKSGVLAGAGGGPVTLQGKKITPYFLHDRSIEINSYQDWWICEKLLQSRHIVFVVAGYPAIGMGHVFRCLMLAHEIADHRVTFLCTKESELAAQRIAAKDYRTKVQRGEDLAAEVLALKPDMVVNDILNTPADYMRALKARGVPVANFEDEGPGADLADLVVNALYEDKRPDPRFFYGHKSFCLRDEFLLGKRNAFRPEVKNLLITFGGTDHSDYTRQTLEALWPVCRAGGIGIAVVTGPGYAHKESLIDRIREMNGGEAPEPDAGPEIRRGSGQAPLVTFTHATNVMSRVMENKDLAVCSAGRTVYELAHMRVPALVIAHHEREDMHTFARPRNGFAYLGVMRRYDAETVQRTFVRLLAKDRRRRLYDRMQRFDFSKNKARVVKRLLALLASGGVS